MSLASTFNGFCNTHDRELFSVIEGNNQITYSPEQKYAQSQLPVKAIDPLKNSVYCSTPTIDIEPVFVLALAKL